MANNYDTYYHTVIVATLSIPALLFLWYATREQVVCGSTNTMSPLATMMVPSAMTLRGSFTEIDAVHKGEARP